MTIEPDHFDVVVLGAGPGGYVAAIEAAKLNKTVALVEAKELGGTCLNRGCIPTKALLSKANLVHSLKKATSWGIEIPSWKINFATMQQDTEKSVSKVRQGLTQLLKAHKVNVIKGYGQFVSKDTLKIKNETGYRQISFTKAIIATGSEPLNIPAFAFNGTTIHSSTSLLKINSLPKSLAIVGGGYIGCEFASLFSELGVKVHIIEALEDILLSFEADIREALKSSLEKRGVTFHCNARVKKIEETKKGLVLQLEPKNSIQAEHALIAIGRRLNTEHFGLEALTLAPNAQGYIEVNDHMQTAVENIYAIGDITGKGLLAHVASHQGQVAALHACGKNAKMHYEAIPAVVFTEPEIATVGMSLEQAQKKQIPAKSCSFPFQALGKAQATHDEQGFSRLIYHPDTHQILGAQVVGHEAGNLIACMALAIQNELTLECIQQTVHAHPTLAETWLENALLALGTPLHLPPR